MGTYGEQNIFCPFFKSFEVKNNMIKCEGLFSHSSIQMTAQNIKELKEWRKKYCESSNYKNCSIAQMLHNKYDKKRV